MLYYFAILVLYSNLVRSVATAVDSPHVHGQSLHNPKRGNDRIGWRHDSLALSHQSIPPKVTVVARKILFMGTVLVDLRSVHNDILVESVRTKILYRH